MYFRVFDNDGTLAEQVSEVQQFEAVYGDLSLPRRLLLAMYKVVYGLMLFCLGKCLCKPIHSMSITLIQVGI